MSGTANPAMGVSLCALGGLAAAVFPLPLKKTSGWAWETSWLVLMAAGAVVAPWAAALIASPNVLSVLRAAPGRELGYCLVCGAVWGVGQLTFGLSLRYLGVGLGYAIIVGLCSAAGTLIPPVVNGKLDLMFNTHAGLVSLAAVLLSLIGIALVGAAGMSKTNELPDQQRRAAVAEFDLRKGLFVAIVAGLTGAAMNVGLQGGETIERLSQTIEPATSDTWKELPVLVVVLTGGFVVNVAWCLYLNVKNRTLADYACPAGTLTANAGLASLGGGLWCSQYFCLKAAESKMGELCYLGWAELMTGVMFFSTIVGILLGEWRNTSIRTRALLACGWIFLTASTALLGYAGYLKQ
jgi:L-rhamnose-H+ transport protein